LLLQGLSDFFARYLPKSRRWGLFDDYTNTGHRSNIVRLGRGCSDVAICRWRDFDGWHASAVLPDVKQRGRKGEDEKDYSKCGARGLTGNEKVRTILVE